MVRSNFEVCLDCFAGLNRLMRTLQSHSPTSLQALPFIVGILICILSGAVNIWAFPQNAPEIIKVEPPSWWAGHTINPVRLLVRGKNLANARVRATSASLQAFDV